MTIPEQLVEIYKDEPWHRIRMSYDEAYTYHAQRYYREIIHVYQENGEVLGYYEREFHDNTCFLMNVYIKKDYRQGKVFRELRKHFLKTLPKNIEYIVGEKQKLGGKFQKVKIRRNNG